MFYDITYDFVFFFSIMRTGTVQFCTLTIYDHFYSTGYQYGRNRMGGNKSLLLFFTSGNYFFDLKISVK